MHSELARRIGGRGDHAALVALAADHDGFPFQRRIVELFHRDEEGVHVDVEDGAGKGGSGMRRGHAGGILAAHAGDFSRCSGEKSFYR